jgi:hypothetical protein
VKYAIVLALLCSSAFAQVDKKYVSLAVASKIALGMDIQTTRTNLDHGCREMNPILGPHPSTGRMVDTTLPINLGLDYLGLRMKRNGSRIWWLPQALGIAVHVAGAANNWRIR